MQADGMIAEFMERSVRQSNFGTRDLNTDFLQRRCNIDRSYGTEEFAFTARIGRNHQLHAGQQFGTRFCRRQVFRRCFLQVVTPRIKFLDVGRRGQSGFARRYQEIATATRRYIKEVADGAKMFHFV